MPRMSGLLLHPTALAGDYGIGDLGPEARRFIDFLDATGQTIWQILPLGPTGFGDSPYACFSTFAGNPLLISPEALLDEHYLADWDVEGLKALAQDHVDFGSLIEIKRAVLHQAFLNFQARKNDPPDPVPEAKPSLASSAAPGETSSEANDGTANDENTDEPGPPPPPPRATWAEFEDFCQSQASWLDDYALFMALKEDQEGLPWYEWPEALRWRDSATLAAAKAKLAEAIAFHQFMQFYVFRQWVALKTYANDHGIQIMGDIPIYVSGDSADVWANPQLFQLDRETGVATLMAGVPPDYFSATGQLWGNPVYDWEALAATGYRWWIDRLGHLFTMVDLIRIDHFRGFESFWAVPQGEETAVNGEWLPGPGAALFEAIEAELGKLPIVAEDLGVITPEVEELRDRFSFPGMKILHFAFDSGSDNSYLPHNLVRNCLVYTGTHDNDTTVGWYWARSEDEQNNITRYLGYHSADGIQWDLIRTAWASVADVAIAPVQDLLGLGSDCRFNLPGAAMGNWAWRLWPGALDQDWLRDRLREFTGIYGRWRA